MPNHYKPKKTKSQLSEQLSMIKANQAAKRYSKTYIDERGDSDDIYLAFIQGVRWAKRNQKPK